MRKGFRNAAAVCAAAALTVSALFIGQVIMENKAIAVTENGEAGVGQIEVVGTGSVKVKPDIAVLNIGVTTNGATTEVQNENTKTMNAVLASVKALGIDEKDIKTVSYYMNPQYDYSASGKGSEKITGYTVYNVVEVKVREIDRAGEVLAAASDAGANVNNGISFRLSDTETYYNEALKKAVANAKLKAEAMAGAIGVQIGLPSKISETNNYYAAPYANYDSMARASMEGGAVTVSQGELEITANVTVIYGY